MNTTLAYDLRQRLTSRTVGAEVTSYNYDDAGQLLKVTLPDASYLTYSYDDAHRLTSMADNLGNSITYTLDAMGNRTNEEVRDPANNLAQTRTRVYNTLNRLFQEIGAQSQTTEYTYDDQGNTLTVKDPLNHTTSNQYDALNRLKQVTDPGLGVTQYAYNGLDALTQVTDPRSLATSYTVNGLGNLTLQASPDTGNTSKTYDTAGNLLTQTDAKSQVTTYAYDVLNRVTLITFHDGSKQAYAYDTGTNGIGRLASITETDPSNDVTSQIVYAYDPHGRVTSDTRTVAGIAYATGYRYDTYGRLDRVTYPSGRTVDYGFDALGRISSVSTTPSGGSAATVASAITYHPFGGVKSFTFGNGQVYTRSYDQDGRIASYTLGSQSFAIGYDAASRIEFIAETGNPSNTNTYGYDALDRLTSAVTPTTPYAYSYDAVGNRVSKTVGTGTDTYAYSPTSNRLASITPGTGPVRTFIFDANGSTNDDANNTYVYDTRGRMVQATSSAGTTTYQVNALGQRVRKTNGSLDTIFTYDAKGHLIAESTAAGGQVEEYVWLADTPIAVIDASGSYFIHVDHLNSPRLITNTAGQAVWRHDHAEPFGDTTPDENPSGLGTFEFAMRHGGWQYADTETGEFWNWMRTYSAITGRFPQSDPIGLSGGLNTYAYVDQDPLRFVDPRGLFLDEVAMAARIVGTATGIGITTLITGAAALALFPSSIAADQPISKTEGLQCNKDDKDDCQKATRYQLKAAKILNEHEFKTEWGAVPNARFDICACKDGSIIIKAVAQCGKSGPAIPTDRHWK
jgi:RHS repeat-associated protein